MVGSDDREDLSLRRGTFLRHVATLAGGTAASQVMLLAAGPILTRLYAPESWGTYSLITSFVAVASVITALFYDQAIVGTATLDDAAAMTLATLWLAPVVTIPSVVVMALFVANGWLGFGVLPWSALVWSAVMLIAMQVYKSLRYWHMRAERFGLLARTSIAQNVGRAAFPSIAAAMAPGWTGLAVGETMGRIVGCVPLLRSHWQETREWFARQSIGKQRIVLKRHSVFATVGAPSALLNAVSQALPLPLIAAGFGTEAAGLFALAQRALQAPLALVGQSVADAFHARIALHNRERPGHVARFFGRTAVLLLTLSVVPIVVVLSLGRTGFAFVFGARWGEAGALTIAMLPWAAAQLVVTPLSRAVLVLGGQRQKLIYDVSSVLLIISCYEKAMSAHWALLPTVVWLSLGQFVAYGIYALVLWGIVRRPR